MWPEIGHPYNLKAATDLMLLHPDGSEEVLVAGGKGAIADPYVSFDAEWVYYTRFHDAGRNNEYASGGADVYKVHVKTRKIVRLTQQQFTPNTGVADWSADYQTPEKGKVNLQYRVVNMHPCPLPGGRVAFVSNRDGFRTPRGYPTEALQLFVMDDDGKNVDKIGHLNVGCALHPVVLKDGRIIFSSLESQGIHANIIWGIWSIHPDGTNWAPVVSALFEAGAPDAFHFQSQLSDGTIVVERYYNQNTLGFGTYYTLPPVRPYGVPGFGPAMNSRDPALAVLGHARGTYIQNMRFQPYGMKVLTRFTHGSDYAAPPSDPKDPKSPRVGKVQHPCGAPDNHLLTIWSPGATNNANGPAREPVHCRHLPHQERRSRSGSPARCSWSSTIPTSMRNGPGRWCPTNGSTASTNRPVCRHRPMTASSRPTFPKARPSAWSALRACTNARASQGAWCPREA